MQGDLVLIGQLVYSVTMWITGIREGAMWRALNSDGSLVYANFIETLTPNYPFWNMRTMGGVIFFTGFLVFVFNIYKTSSMLLLLKRRRDGQGKDQGDRHER